MLQELYHGSRFFGVDFCDLDYAGIARGFGLVGLRVDRAQEIEPVLREALACGGPAFVDIATESETGELPPVARWQKLKGEEGAHA